MPGTEIVRQDQLDNIIIEGANIGFKNFTGKEGPYNQEGDRNFCVFLDPMHAEELARKGWNIKVLRPREDGEEPNPYLQVSVRYVGRGGNKVRPPVIYLITSRGRTPLGEEECEFLDWVDIANVDINIRPYQWAVNGKTGVKAYLKAIYVTMEEDRLMRKYADVKVIRGGVAALTDGSDDQNEEIWDAEVVSEELNPQLAIER